MVFAIFKHAPRQLHPTADGATQMERHTRMETYRQRNEEEHYRRNMISVSVMYGASTTDHFNQMTLAMRPVSPSSRR